MSADREKSDSREVEADQTTARPRPQNSRVRFWLLLSIPLACGAAGLSWWTKKSVPGAYGTLSESPPTPNFSPAERLAIIYSRETALRSYTPTQEYAELLQRYDAKVATVRKDVSERVAELCRKDTHLRAALTNSRATPFVGPESKSLAEARKGCEYFCASLVQESLESDLVEEATRDSLEPSLYRTIISITRNGHHRDADIQALRDYRDSGGEDGFVLACLARAINGDSVAEEKELASVARLIFQYRDRRKYTAPSAAFVYCTLVKFRDELTKQEFGQTSAEAIEVFDRVWRWTMREKINDATEDFLLSQTFKTTSALRFPALVDLLLKLDHGSPTSVPEYVKFHVASELSARIALEYRGTRFISETPESDLKRFDQHSKRVAQYMMKAWLLKPENHLLAGRLTSWQTASGTTPLTSDQWFRLSINEVVDSSYAFDRYHNAIESKWGGGRERQLQFAEKCVEAGIDYPVVFFRFAPAIQIRIWEQAFTESLGSNLRIRRLALNVVRELKKYSETKIHNDVDVQTLSPVIAILWQAGDFAELDWLLSTYRNQVNCEWLHHYRVHSDEIRNFCRAVLLSTTPGCWYEIHGAVHGYTHELNRRQLDRLDLALAQAREDAIDQAEVLALLAKYQRRSEVARELVAGNEVAFSESDLRDWYTAGDSVSTIGFKTDQEAGAGVFDLRVSANVAEGRAILPLRVEPPLSLAVEIESPLVNQTSVDPYGISLMIGPACYDAFVSDLCGPIYTFIPDRKFLVRDQLPFVQWNQGSVISNRIKKSDVRSCDLRLDVFADGYRAFFNGKPIGDVPLDARTEGWVQIGRYCNANYRNVQREEVHYRISNVRLRRLTEGTTLLSERPDSNSDQ